ncbi:hypothetical protein EYF80_023079 [Liparis tanakae]|uniref:Uncharacterized protein n=1 Tax=Liparis tanakae TaxID=230148 RepID=A0A4Z2HM97_9TELE|nr:hypothetical protein EYF80_023079 [Liparis tanakae]
MTLIFVWLLDPRRNWELRPLFIPPCWDPGVIGELLIDHRLVYWLHRDTETRRRAQLFFGSETYAKG